MSDPSPWEWDKEAQRYKYWVPQQQKWIWHESTEAAATVQSTEIRPKKSKSKRDSHRPSGEQFENPGELYHGVNQLNLNKEYEEEEDPPDDEVPTPRPSYRASPPTRRQPLRRYDAIPNDNNEDFEDDDGNGWDDDGDDNVGGIDGGNNHGNQDGNDRGDVQKWTPIDDDILMITNKYTRKPFRRYHERIFKPGFVFQCMFNQEAGPSDDRTSTTSKGEAENNYGQAIHTEIRIFVVLRNNGDHSSSCLSVQTYKQRGVAKSGLRKSNFAIFYSGPSIPPLPPDEEPDLARAEDGMRDAIQMEMASRIDRVDPMSRIHLRAIHCCQHNWKIYPFGHIPRHSMATLLTGHYAALNDPDGGKPGPKKGGSKSKSTRRPPTEQARRSSYQVDSSRGYYSPNVRPRVPPSGSYGQ